LRSKGCTGAGSSYICAVEVRTVIVRRRRSLSLGRGKDDGGQQGQEEEQIDVLHDCKSDRGEVVQNLAMDSARHGYVSEEELVPGKDLDSICDIDIVL
jgi:hypothetical protein